MRAYAIGNEDSVVVIASNTAIASEAVFGADWTKMGTNSAKANTGEDMSDAQINHNIWRQNWIAEIARIAHYALPKMIDHGQTQENVERR